MDVHGPHACKNRTPLPPGGAGSGLAGTGPGVNEGERHTGAPGDTGCHPDLAGAAGWWVARELPSRLVMPGTGGP